jgi:uncharacterized protein YaiI (UPF0178 family)
MKNEFRIYVDADASPKAVKEILFRAAKRNKIFLILVANQKIGVDKSEYISNIVVDSGFDEADDKIVEIVKCGDLVVSDDVPLASRVIDKGAVVITFRGVFYDETNIKQRLTTRDLLEELRNSGVETGGPALYSQRDRKNFADQLDRLLTKKINI